MERSGKWITKFADNGWMDWTCSECGWTWNDDVHVNLKFNYCPNCGAKMNSNYLPKKPAYALYVATEWLSCDTHHNDHLLGIYSSEEKAEEALERYKKLSVKDIFICDNYTFWIGNYNIDADIYLD
ncbi:MAG: hypothetical protein J6U54_05330 [Clostridiales bacterium]|nr:hypothetical protein [Clostridiales bacterium]